MNRLMRFFGLDSTSTETRRRQSQRQRRSARLSCEDLEGRQLLSTYALLNASGIPSLGPLFDLQVFSTSNSNDTIHISNSSNNVSIGGGPIYTFHPGGGLISSSTVPASYVAFSQVILGSGNDTVRIDNGVSIPVIVTGGSGTDRLITSGSNDSLYAGSGNTTLIALGGKNDTLVGGSGQDSFWYDSGATVQNTTYNEQYGGMIHYLPPYQSLAQAEGNGYMSYTWTSNALNGAPGLPSPWTSISGATYQNFSNDPLFASDGPSINDITQGRAGDCTFLSALAGLVRNNPGEIRNMIVDLGDGTYEVDFKPNGHDQYVRVNAELPVDSSGRPLYAQLGHQNSLWVALLEKAWCFERPTGGSWYSSYAGSYSNIDGGGSNEIWTMLNVPYATLDSSTPGDLFTNVAESAASGYIVTAGTYGKLPAQDGLVSNHCYLVDHVNYNAYGSPVSVTLRNPWNGSNGSAVYVTVTASVFDRDFYGSWVAFD